MGIDIDLPQVRSLRKDVEDRFGCSLLTPRYFDRLSGELLDGREYLSPTTLMRVWKYKKSHQNRASVHTLNVLSRYAGYRDWPEFIDNYNATRL